ncbi:hypothetical protein [Coleofasciculus chthonoplastes]|uniref:hypothetical protein n=1 Tax=Coleofasciculus chthonoplastes TaxID=64178 RepID=UPI0032FE8714
MKEAIVDNPSPIFCSLTLAKVSGDSYVTRQVYILNHLEIVGYLGLAALHKGDTHINQCFDPY